MYSNVNGVLNSSYKQRSPQAAKPVGAAVYWGQSDISWPVRLYATGSFEKKHRDLDTNCIKIAVRLVELTGIEPVSEKRSALVSTGVVCLQDSPGIRRTNAPTRR